MEELQKKQQALKQPNASTASNLTNLTSIKPASAGAVGLNGMNKAQINPFDFNNKIDSSMAGNFIAIPNLAQHSNGGHQREKGMNKFKSLKENNFNFIRISY